MSEDEAGADVWVEEVRPWVLLLHPDCQPRLSNREDVIAEYAELMAAGHQFPAIKARFDGAA